MKNQYDDIIQLPHHVSENRPHMSMIDRAAQFSPFAALTGYGAAVEETARLTDRRIELDDEMKKKLSKCLNLLQNMLQENHREDSELPEVEITYFVPDERKDGGVYHTAAGIVKKIDIFQRIVVLADGTDIPIDDIIEIGGEIFHSLDDSYA